MSGPNPFDLVMTKTIIAGWEVMIDTVDTYAGSVEIRGTARPSEVCRARHAGSGRRCELTKGHEGRHEQRVTESWG